MLRHDLKIRTAEAADAPAVWRAHVEAIRVLCRGDYAAAEIEAWAGPRKPEDYLGQISGGRIFVAEADGKIAGFAEFSGEEIRAVYVRPEFVRGGVGRALFTRVLAEMKARGVRIAQLDASITSVPFYTAMGCAPGAPLRHRLSSGIEIACVSMSVDLERVLSRLAGR